MKKKLIGLCSIGSVFGLAYWLTFTGVVPVALVGAGCSTTNTNVVTTNSQQVINAAALVLRGAAKAGALTAIADDPASKAYFQLAAAGLGTLVTGN